MDEVKCDDCGHINPAGTVLCESCGKPIEGNQHKEGNDKKRILNMRYDGTARRSQTYNKSIVDRIWSFFSSVKVGIWLIVAALIASAIGTIFPQEQYIPEDAPSREPSVYYEHAYGILGKIYYQLGLHHLYSSWWYLLILALVGISLVICSLDRFVPLYHALKQQKAKRHKTFISRQRLYRKTDDVSDEDKEKMVSQLKKRRYKITNDNGHVLAEKGRFSRWGPYVNHIGLIIVLIAAILRSFSFFYLDDYVWAREGELMVIPSTDSEFYIENEEFTVEYYDEDDEEDAKFKESIENQGGDLEKNFQSDAVVYRDKNYDNNEADMDLEKVADDEIELNHPLKFSGYALYQAGFQEDEFTNMTFDLQETAGGDDDALDTFTVDLNDPESEYELDDGSTVELTEYFPDYYMDDGEPKSETNYPRNPAFVFTVTPPDGGDEEVSFVGVGMNVDPTNDNDYEVALSDVDTRDVAGLTVRRDYTLPLFGLGAAVFLIGVVQGLYWQHRRIWIRPKNGSLLVGAHTNKNWYGIKKDIEYSIEGTQIEMVDDLQELDE